MRGSSVHDLLDACARALEAHPDRVDPARLVDCGRGACCGRYPAAAIAVGGLDVVLPSCGHLPWIPWWAWRARARARALDRRARGLRIAHESARLLAAEPAPDALGAWAADLAAGLRGLAWR